MAKFEETKTVSQVAILPNHSAINVQWVNRVEKDGVVISESFERKAYAEDQKDDFLKEVEGAKAYAKAAGWK